MLVGGPALEHSCPPQEGSGIFRVSGTYRGYPIDATFSSNACGFVPGQGGGWGSWIFLMEGAGAGTRERTLSASPSDHEMRREQVRRAQQAKRDLRRLTRRRAKEIADPTGLASTVKARTLETTDVAWGAPWNLPGLGRPTDSGFSASGAARISAMSLAEMVGRWPLLRQFREGDPLGLGRAAQSQRSRELKPRSDEADHVVQSICPYCAVGCGQLVYVKDGEVSHIDGDPASPISRGRLCPKGQASKSYVSGPLREYKVKYRRPYGTRWEELSLDDAMEMIAQRVIDTRAETWQEETEDGNPANRTLGIGNLGGATLDNEENYLIKKLCVALGIVQVENQARI